MASIPLASRCTRLDPTIDEGPLSRRTERKNQEWCLSAASAEGAPRMCQRTGMRNEMQNEIFDGSDIRHNGQHCQGQPNSYESTGAYQLHVVIRSARTESTGGTTQSRTASRLKASSLCPDGDKRTESSIFSHPHIHKSTGMLSQAPTRSRRC